MIRFLDLNKKSACGAFSFVNKDLEECGVYAGIPAKKIKDRAKTAEELSKKIKNGLEV